MNSKIKVIALLSLALALGCSERKAKPINNHNKKTLVIETRPDGEAQFPDQNLVPDFDRLEEAYKKGVDPYNNLIVPTSKVVLNKTIAYNKDRVRSKDFENSVSYFYKGILLLEKSNLNAKELESVLNKFYSLYVESCSEAFENCELLNRVKYDKEFSSILLLVSKKLKLSMEENYNLLYLVSDYKNRNWRKDFEEAYLVNSKEYLDSLVSRGGNEALQRHLRMTYNVIHEIDDFSEIPTNVLERLLTFEPLNYNNKAQNVEKSLQNIILDRVLATLKKKESDNSKFLYDKLVKDAKESLKNDYGSLLKDPILKRLKFNTVLDSDGKKVAAYALNKLIKGAWEDAVVASALEVANLNQADHVEAFKTLIHWEEVRLVKRSGQYIFSVYQEKLGIKGNEILKRKPNIFSEVLQQAQNLDREWEPLFSKSEQALSIYIDLLGRDSSEYSELVKFRSSLGREVNMLATYPNMLMQLYFISKTNFSKKIRWWIFEFTRTPYVALESFLLGRERPWFKFSDLIGGEGQLSSSDMLFVFDFALKTGLFELYNLKPEVVINELMSRFVKVPSDTYHLYFKELAKIHYPESSPFRKALRVCAGEEVEELKLQFLGEYLSMNLTELTDFSLSGTPTLLSFTTTLETSFEDVPTYFFFDTIDRVRRRLSPRIDYFSFIIDSYQQYLQGEGESIQPAMRLQDSLSEFKSKLAYNYGTIFTSLKDLIKCEDKVIENQLSRAEDVFKYEREYLKWVYKKLNGLEEGTEKLAEVNEEAKQFIAAPKGFPVKDGFRLYADGYYYTYNKLDFLFRVKRYLENGLVLDATELPKIAKNPIKVSVPTGTDYISGFGYVGSELTSTLRAKNVEFSDFLSAAWKRFLPESVSRLEKTHDVPDQYFSTWYKAAELIALSRKRPQILATLRKIGKVDYIDFNKRGCNYNLEVSVLSKSCMVSGEVKLEDLVSEALAGFRMFGIADESLQLYKELGLFSKISKDQIQLWVFDGYTEEPGGVMNQYHSIMGKRHFGYNFREFDWYLKIVPNSDASDYARTSRFDDASLFYKAYLKNRNMDLHVNQNLHQKLYSKYRSDMYNEYLEIKEIEDLQDKDTLLGFGQNGHISFRFSTNESTPYAVPFLNSSAKKSGQLLDEYRDELGDYFKIEDLILEQESKH